MNRDLAGLPGRPLVEAEHEGRLPLALAIHGTRHSVLSRRAVPRDRLHVIGQLDLIILTCRIGGGHTPTAWPGFYGYETPRRPHQRPTPGCCGNWGVSPGVIG